MKKATAVNLLADSKDFYISINGSPDANLMAFGGLQTNLMAGTGLRALPVN